MQTIPLVSLVAAVATRQHGVVSKQQLAELGFKPVRLRHWRETGRLEPLLPGVFRVAGAPVGTEQLLSAAVLWAGTDALVSHRSAGALWGFDDMNPAKPEITVPIAMSKRIPQVVVHRTRNALAERRTRHGLATTTPERTLIDLAGSLRPDELEIALESARRERLVTTASVERSLVRLGPRGRDGIASLQALLTALGDDAPSESALEVLTARLLRASDLAKPQRQVEVTAFGKRYLLDFAWPFARVALECDGKKWHEFERDRRRWSSISSATGYRIIWATKQRVTREPEQLVAEVREALNQEVRDKLTPAS
jgi:very-short-patch-repair endonuclease